MRLNRAATALHKWLALLMAAQILLWVASGLFFAVVPIERVRSEHMIAPETLLPMRADMIAEGLRRVGAAEADQVEIRPVLGRPAAVLMTEGARPRLYDLATGRALSPIDATLARRIAEAADMGDRRATGVTLVRDESPEYRAMLPAWRVDFDDGADSIYVAVDTGKVMARRSTLWRIYDVLWSLHIMDYDAHEDFNTPLLIGAATLALFVVVSGVVMLPSRLRRTRRKPASAAR
jgi:hypothetical protein